MYKKSLDYFEDSVIDNVKKLSWILKKVRGNLFITGLGKSGYICQKAASTWLTLGLKIRFVRPEDLIHGEMGAFSNGDTLIILSNVGNSQELVSLSKYINENFEIVQILITNNKKSKISRFVNHKIFLGNSSINEISHQNVPTVSSVIYMVLLDLLAFELLQNEYMYEENISKFHPAGNVF